MLREGFSLEKRVGALGRHASSSSAFDIQACDEINLILSHEGYLDAQLIEEDGTVIQTGIVRPYLSTGYTGTYRENVSMELIDYSEKLREYVWPEPDDKDDKKPGRVYPMSWKNVTLSTVVGWILHQCGMSRFGSVPAITIPVINISEGQYLKDVLEDLLFGYGLDYRFSATGIPEIFSTFAPDVITDEITDIIGDVSVERNDDTSDGVEITYATAKHIDKATIFSSSLHEQPFGANLFYEEGGWYDGERHSYRADTILPEWTKYDYPYKNTTGYEWLKSVKDGGDKVSKDDIFEVYVGKSGDEVDNEYYKAWMKDEKGITLNPRLSWYDLSGGCFWVDYKGWFQSLVKGWTFNVELYGDVTYRKESFSSYKAEGPRPEKVYLEYVVLDESDTSYARDFAEKYYYRQKNGKISVQFLSSIPLDPGEFYRLGGSFPAVAGFNMGVRVLVVTRGEDGLYTISAEGCSGIEVTQAVERHDVFDARPLSFTGIVSGGYDKEGNNDSGMVGAYISPDGEAKFNSIKIEGDGALFESPVFKNIYSGTEIEIGTVSQPNQWPGEVGPLITALESLPAGEFFHIQGGTFVIYHGGYQVVSPDDSYLLVTRENKTEEVDGSVHDYVHYRIGIHTDRTLLSEIDWTEFNKLDNGVYYTYQMESNALVLKNVTEGIATKDIRPIDSEREYSIEGFSIAADKFYSLEGQRMFQPTYSVAQLNLNDGYYMILPGGYAMQWGVRKSFTTSVTFPIPFANADYMVQLTESHPSDNGSTTGGYSTAPGVLKRLPSEMYLTVGSSRAIHWLAIGKI